jgi:hypothetical protein
VALAPGNNRRVVLLMVDVALKSLHTVPGPGEDGSHVIVALKPLFPYAVAVQTTAYTVDEFRPEITERLMLIAFLQKPFSPDALRARAEVRSFLSRWLWSP